MPYGVYDLADNSGWVSVGVTSDTAEFAVNAIRSWFDKRGRDLYPAASRLMITAPAFVRVNSAFLHSRMKTR